MVNYKQGTVLNVNASESSPGSNALITEYLWKIGIYGYPLAPIGGDSTININTMGYSIGTTYELELTITNDCGKTDTTSEVFTIIAAEPTKGYLIIKSTPVGASITYDGIQQVNVTPFIYHIDSGSHTIKLTKTGYNDYIETVNINDGETTTINATLVPETACAILTVLLY